MGVDDLENLQANLARLTPMLSGITSAQIDGAPEIRRLLEQIVETLADIDLLKNFGYLTIDQAQTKICDMFQEAVVPRIKTFHHCGQDHPYHALQTYVRCPLCKSFRMKTSHLFAHDDLECVASMALIWLGIDERLIPGWNFACDAFNGSSQSASRSGNDPPSEHDPDAPC